MKYTIVIDQAGIAKDEELLKHTDIIDWVIIDYLSCGTGRGAVENGKRFMLCDKEHITEQVPLLKIDHDDLWWRIYRMAELGLTEWIRVGDRLYARATRKAINTKYSGGEQ